MTTIKLEHKYTITGISLPSYSQNFPQQANPLTAQRVNYATANKVTPRPVYNTPARTSNQCGIRNKKIVNFATSLVIGGQETIPNEFPWLVALLHKRLFTCSGSLVSNKIVVTAAHCIRNKGEISNKKPVNSQFLLGKYDLSDSEESGAFGVGVEIFIVHPQWQPNVQSYNADIAVAVLDRSVAFTRTVLPICLWPNTNSYNDLVNKKGFIAGNYYEVLSFIFAILTFEVKSI